MIFSLRFFWTYCLAFLALTSWGQVSFTAKAPAQSDTQQAIRLDFVLSNAEGVNFVAPNLSNFELLAGPSESRYASTSMVNGQYSSQSSTTYTLVVRAKKAGKLQVGAASVVVKGKTLRTAPCVITVLAAQSSVNAAGGGVAPSQRSVSSRGLNEIRPKDLYFTARTPKTTIYEQEPLVLTYQLHAREGIGLSNVMLAKTPDFKNLIAQELPIDRQLATRNVQLGGLRYIQATSKQYVLFAQQSGRQLIPPASFDCELVQRTTIEDEFNAFFNGADLSNRHLIRQSNALSIQVLPLPSPRPANYANGVGHFTMKVGLLTPNLRSHEMATLRVSLTGNGNLKFIKAPTAVFSKDFEVYPPKRLDNIRVDTEGMRGSVHFDYLFVPRKAGRYRLPHISFCYFDTQTKRYQTLTAAEETISVAPSEKADRATEPSHGLNERSENQDTIQSVSIAVQGGSVSLWSGVLGFVVLLFTLLVVYLLWHFRKSILRVGAKRQRNAYAIAQSALSQAEKALAAGADQTFYECLSSALVQYLNARLAMTNSAVSRVDILQALRESGCQETDVADLEALLQAFDFARFAPSSEVALQQEHLLRTQALLQRLETWSREMK